MSRLGRWIGLFVMIMIATVVGYANYWVFINYSNERNIVASDVDATNDAVTNYLVVVGLVWGLIASFITSKAENKFEKVQAAIYADNEQKFQMEVRKRLSLSIRLLHAAVSISFVAGFHQYHMENWSAIVQTQFGSAFLVTLATVFLIDLESPLYGIINAEDIPREWRVRLRQKEQAFAERQSEE